MQLLILLIISFWKSSAQCGMNNKEDTMSAQNPKILNYKENSKNMYLIDSQQ